MWKLVATTVLAALACAAAATFAGATAPGVNGRLVFTADAGKHSQLFTIEPDGTGLKQITHFATGDSGNANWSPDGKQIIFDGPRGVTTMTADGGSVKVIAPHTLGPKKFVYQGGGAYSPNGKWVALGREVHFEPPNARPLDRHDYTQVIVMRSDGTGERPVAPKLIIGSQDANHYGEHMQFSPDGKRILFVKQTRDGAAVFTVGPDGKGMKQLTPYRLGVDDREDWSPNGKLIVFSNAHHDAKGIVSNIYTVRPDGTGLTRVTHEENGSKIDDKADSWSPDGKQIMFVRATPGGQNLYAMNADGSGMTRVTHGLNVHGGSWGTHP